MAPSGLCKSRQLICQSVSKIQSVIKSCYDQFDTPISIAIGEVTNERFPRLTNTENRLYFGEKESRVPVALSYLPCDVFLSRIIKRLPARFQGVADDIFHHDIVGRYIKSTVVPYLTTK